MTGHRLKRSARDWFGYEPLVSNYPSGNRLVVGAAGSYPRCEFFGRKQSAGNLAVDDFLFACLDCTPLGAGLAATDPTLDMQQFVRKHCDPFSRVQR